MNLRMRRHDWYIGKSVLGAVLLAWGVLLGLDLVLSMSGEFKNIGMGSYSLGHVVAWAAYTVPRRAYTLFPMAAVIGSLMGLGQLAATSELTAMRALGLSRRRLALSVVITLSLLTALMVISGETLGPMGQSRADNLRNSARSNTDIATAPFSGLWARDRGVFLNVQTGQENLHPDGRSELVLHGVDIYRVDANGRLVERTHAETATHDGSGWSLQDVRRDHIGENTVRRETLPQLAWDSQLDPSALASGLARPRNLSAAELRANIEYRKRNGLDARDYEDTYWSRWFYPINVLALCLAAVPFAFGSLRSGGMGKRLFLGMLFALSFWLLQMFFGRMAGALRFDYRIAYALPPLVMLAVSAFIFRRKVG